MDKAEMEALRKETLARMTEKLTTKVCDLTRLWWDIGVVGVALKNRLGRTEEHVDRLLSEMYKGEEDMRQRMVASNERLSTQVRELSEQLGLPLTLPESGLTALEQDSVLRTTVAELNLIKTQRKKERRRLLAEDAELRAKLGQAPPCQPWCSPIPSEEELLQISQNIAKLTEIKIMRQGKFWALRQEIIDMVRLLDAKPESPKEQEIVLEDPSQFLLSTSNLQAVEEYLQQLKDLEAQRRREHASLVERLSLYWERLDTPKAEREELQRAHSGLTAAALDALQQQIAGCEVLKRQKMQEFICRARDELLTWYSMCCVPKRRAQLEEDWDSEDWSEERLEWLEKELRTLKHLHAEHKDVFSKVERRETLWARLLDFERRTADPARLNNRGGRLLAEMKERKRLETELPRLEKEIMSYIDNYTGDEKEVFEAWSAEFLAHLEAQHATYNEEKERERLERELRRQQGPATPNRAGAKRPGQGTPACCSASKMSRLGMSSGASTMMVPTTPSTKAQQHPGTPSRRSPLRPIQAASLRKRATARKLCVSGVQGLTAAAPRPVAAVKASQAVPEGSFCSFEGFAQGLTHRPVERPLTSSVIEPAATTDQAARAANTLCAKRSGEQ
ncbi:protein regulator of cytokinesis 1-like [Haemaphysalis longicornis]